MLDRMMRAAKCRDLISLSRYLSVGQSTISNWKSEKTIPYKHLHVICEREKVSFDWLLMGRSDYVVNEHPDPYIANTVRNMEALDLEGKKDVSAVSEKTKRLQDLLREKEGDKAA